MEKQVVATALFFVCVSIGLNPHAHAQEYPVLAAKPLPVIAIFSPNVVPSKRLSRSSKPQVKENKFLVTVDFPLLPRRNMASIRGIENQPFGRSVKLVEKDIGPKHSLFPKVSFSSKNVHASYEGFYFVVPDYGKKREIFQTDGAVEGSLWLVLVGARGFYFEETTPFILWGDNYQLDFERDAYGATAWLGVKLGSFHKNFIVARIGQGLIESRGQEVYVSSVLSHPIYVTLYSQRYDVDHFSSEGRVRIYNLAPSLTIESSRYRRSNNPNNYFGLIESTFRDTKVEGRLEVIPHLKKDMLRVFVQRTEYFGSWNRLLFRNENSSWQVYIRLAFK